MKLRILLPLAACSLALSACGGDDSSPPPSGGGGTPAPTPTPSPTPTPTPTPTPSPTYQTFNQLTGDREFQTACGGIEQFGGPRPITASAFGEGVSQGRSLELAFVDGTDTWNITGPGFTTSFGPSDLSATQQPNITSYARANLFGGSNRFQVAALPFGAQAPEYVRGSRLFIVPQSGQALDFFCVLGVPTLLSDSTPPSTITYASLVLRGTVLSTGPAGVAQFDLTDSTATLSANPANGAVTTRIVLIGRQFTPTGLSPDQVQLGTYEGTATVDGSVTSFNDRLTSTNKVSLDSNFGGWFFGPQGIEAGYAFNILVEEPDGTRLTGGGAVTARR